MTLDRSLGEVIIQSFKRSNTFEIENFRTSFSCLISQRLLPVRKASPKKGGYLRLLRSTMASHYGIFGIFASVNDSR